MRYRVDHSKIKFISTRGHVISSIYLFLARAGIWVPFVESPEILGHIILCVSSKRRRLEARNFAVILIFVPFTTYEKTSFIAEAGAAGRSFEPEKVLGTFGRRAPSAYVALV